MRKKPGCDTMAIVGQLGADVAKRRFTIFIINTQIPNDLLWWRLPPLMTRIVSAPANFLQSISGR